jgi:endonuclease/exonuclease/phosphatase family metal-dependent hydrolase
MKKRIKRIMLLVIVMAVLVAVGIIWFIYATHSGRDSVVVASDGRSGSDSSSETTTLTIMTLNVAHGRAEGVHQVLQRRATIETHLDGIAEVLVREGADVIALQESDGPSIWSGDFDHVAYLAEHAQYGHYCRGEHVDGLGLSYGTALLSRRAMKDCRSVTFDPSPPTFTKGFVVSTVPWPGGTAKEVRVVSVHLDFSRESVRQQQVRTMIDELSADDSPLIIMGDFNCEFAEGGPLGTLAEGLDLSVYQPEADDLPTFVSSDKRLDWILLSPELSFVEYRILPDALSDHRAVVAVVRWRD